MKVSEIKQLIENIVTDEVRKTIIEESEGKKEVYHIKCEGIPLATFATEEEANEALPDYKDKNTDGELIIEKGVYESHDDMMDKLDEMNDQLEETENMENTQMDEKLVGNQDKLDKNHNGEIDGQDFKIMKGQKSSDEEECDECGGGYMEEEEEEEDNQSDMDKWNMDQMKDSVKKHFGNSDDEEKEDDDSYFEEMLRRRRRKYKSVDNEETPDEMGEEKKCCEKCGKEMCECGSGGMYESKKKTLRLTETELTKMIAKMVSESIPGLDAAKKVHDENGKLNKDNVLAVEKKIVDFNNVKGNDNPKFPNAIGKGEKVARKNTSKEEETIEDNRGRNPLDLTYDIEPSDQFKDRLKKSIEGHSTMGNAPTTEKPSIKPSNGADKGEESKDKDGNVIATPETGKKFEKESKRRIDIKKDEPVYNKEAVPVKSKSKSINEEVEKMKKMFNYNKKTQ